MNQLLLNQELSQYNKYILNKILVGFDVHRDFNIYELIEESVLHKCILPSQNELVMDTYYTIKEYLVSSGFINELKEMASYTLTARGLELKSCGSIEKYLRQELKRNKRSIFHLLFKAKQPQQPQIFNRIAQDYYE